ncbi:MULTISPECIES: hypothetical protein [Nostoc]|uniref:Uncharacterized protein n=1 Tax=Nostoc paludosum FACHB-159 TaxID=2692908 RepID=A0ABR8KMP7_9NOSO|nr:MULTISPECIES: hypothetical protein [Nostoc]MBD2683574.1 hypothetical protein [Nostoc sp. FACHB-857]MBD2739893.1 hypothetical protein [Nostoc paludosum FACHB-159]
MKALYKGMSYLIGQEQEIHKQGGDVNRLIADLKRMMTEYLEKNLG